MGQLQLALVWSFPQRKPWGPTIVAILEAVSVTKRSMLAGFGKLVFEGNAAARAAVTLASVEQSEAVAVARLARAAAVSS
jgi:hypothetical protein